MKRILWKGTKAGNGFNAKMEKYRGIYWNWRGSVSEYIKFGAILLFARFIYENVHYLNNSFTKSIPVGWILLLLVSILLTSQILWVFKWTKIWSRKRWKQEWLIIHWGIYLIMISVIFSLNLNTTILPDALSDNSLIEILDTNIQQISLLVLNDLKDNFNDPLPTNDIETTPLQIYLTPIPSVPVPSVPVPTVSKLTTISTPIVSTPTPFVYKYNSSPKTINFEYNLHGNKQKISYTVYGGMNDYLKKQPREISYKEGQLPPTDVDFVMRDLNDKEQKTFIDPLIYKIQNITSNKDDQARIAISLVQNIDYDWQGFETGIISGKYPYEVLYTNSGVCGEKTELLAYMLREIGYEVVIFRFDIEQHDAVGIKCPQQYSFKNSGYCFVESTTPKIITDSSGDYVGVGELTSKPDILKISEGNSFDSVSKEYNDAVTLNMIYNMGSVLDENNYNKWVSLVNKYGIKPSEK